MLPSSGHQPCVPLQPREGLRQPRGVAGRRGLADLRSIRTAGGRDLEGVALQGFDNKREDSPETAL